MGTHLALLEHWSSDDNSFGGNEACVKQTEIIVKIKSICVITNVCTKLNLGLS